MDDIFAYETPVRLTSPCINVCRLDARTDRCIGCRRTAADIARWSVMDEGERRAVMADLSIRAAR